MTIASVSYRSLDESRINDDVGLLIDDRYPACKAFADVVVAAMLLALAGPLLLFLMAMVKLTSRGPALYSQLRVGHGGRVFRIFKLRSMRNDCEKQTGALSQSGPKMDGLG
jgi:lipopolysaccharide/colanic/teichoic acid biosynthesis glycosyltransferase